MKPKFQYDKHHIEERTCHYPMTRQDLYEARVENRQSIPSSSSKKNFDQGKEGSSLKKNMDQGKRADKELGCV